MISLNTLISNLDLLLSQNIGDDAVRCSIIAKRLHRYLRPDWLPPEAKVGSEHCYQRHCIHEDPAGRFCVGSFVWKPGQETPVHDHSCWGGPRLSGLGQLRCRTVWSVTPGVNRHGARGPDRVAFADVRGHPSNRQSGETDDRAEHPRVWGAILGDLPNAL